jgi:hypothetical protein
MSPANNNTKRLKSIKNCPNHCGTWIAWNPSLNRFIQAKTGEIHLCPKWKPNQQRKAPYKKIETPRKIVTHVDTTRLAIPEILPVIDEMHSAIEELLKVSRKLLDSIAPR